MSGAPVTSAPLGVGRINPNDHGPILLITAAITLGITGIAITLRLFQRWPWSSLLRLEDYLLIAATVCEIGDIAAVGVAVHYGMGQHVDKLSHHQAQVAQRALIASLSITFVVEAAGNLSLLLFLSMMYSRKENRIFFQGLGAIIAAWGVAGVVRIGTAAIPGTASLNKTTWIVFGVISILIQLTLFSFSMYTIWGLQMSVSKKLGCSVYLGLCIPAAVVTATRLVYTPHETLTGDFTWNDMNMVTISLIESNLVIISAAYPSMRNFLTKVSTGFLVAGVGNEGTSGSHGGSYALRGTKQRSNVSKQEAMSKSWTNGENVCTIRGDAKSDKSYGSQVIMIRTSIEVNEAEDRETEA